MKKIMMIMGALLLAAGSQATATGWVATTAADNFTSGSGTSAAFGSTGNGDPGGFPAIGTGTYDYAYALSSGSAATPGGPTSSTASIIVISHWTRLWVWTGPGATPATATTTISYKYSGSLSADATGGTGSFPRPRAQASINWILPFSTNLSNSVLAISSGPQTDTATIPLTSGSDTHAASITIDPETEVATITDTAESKLNDNNISASSHPTATSNTTATSGQNRIWWIDFTAP